jgi:mycothiol synthase
MTGPHDPGLTVRSFRLGDEPRILAVAEASLAVDAFPGFDRADVLHSIDRLAGDPEGTVVAFEDGEIVGYCTPRQDLLTVHPDHRRRGHGRRLVQAAIELVRARGLADLILYGPVDHPPAAGFIETLGFRYHSSLWQFELARSIEVPGPSFPSDVMTRAYRDADLEAFVALANLSFADHPTPVSFTTTAVAHVHGLPGFDPGDILLVTPRDDRERLVAWTKTEAETGDDGVRHGTVAMIGVVPDWRGRGLGRELLRWGIAHLRATGAETIELAVEAANDRALGMYRRAGFVPAIEWPHYALPTGPPRQ